MASRRSTPAKPVHTSETAVATAVVEGVVIDALDIDNLPDDASLYTVANVDALTVRVGEDYARDGRANTIRAAKATHLAYAAGILTPKGHKKAAHAVTPAAFADRFGSTRTNVYAWRVIGRAIMVHGIDGEDLALMLGKNLAQYPPLVAAIDADDATPETVRAAIADAIDPETGKRRAITREGAVEPNDGTTVGSIANDEGALVPVGRDLAGLSTLMVGAVSILGTMSDEDYRKGCDMIVALLAECDEARANRAA